MSENYSRRKRDGEEKSDVIEISSVDDLVKTINIMIETYSSAINALEDRVSELEKKCELKK